MEAQLFIFAAVAISEVFSVCKPSESKFENFQETPRRSVRFIIGITSKKCAGLDEFYYRWTVIQLLDYVVVQKSEEATLSIDGYTYDSDSCYKSKYLVRIEVSHYPDMRSADQASRVFYFAPDNMYVEIAGGTERTHALGIDLVVNAKSLSIDRSYPPHEDAFKGNTVLWEIFPEIEGYSPPENLVITVPKKFLKMNMFIHFKVSVSRTKIPQFKDIQVAIQTVKVVSPFVPQLTIKCIRNCILPHFLEPVAFTAECSKNCRFRNYRWTVEPEPPPGKTDFGTGYDKLVVFGNSYKEGETISVTIEDGGARVVKTLTFVSGLTKGSCNIYPLEGISSITKFKIRCKGFSSPHGIINYMIYQLFNSGSVLIHETTYKEFSEVTLAYGDPAILSVVVQDNAFLQVAVTLTLVVRKYSAQKNLPLAAEMKNLVLNAHSRSIMSQSLERFNNEVVQLVSSLVGAMKAIQMDKPTARDLHKHMAVAIGRSDPVRFSSNVQRLSILKKLQEYKFSEDTVTAQVIGTAMKENSISTHMMYNHKESGVPQFFIDHFFEENLELAGELMRESKLIKAILNGFTQPHNYDSYDDFEQTKIQIREDFKKIITDVTVTLQTNCITVLHKAIPNQRSSFFKSKFIYLIAKRLMIESVKTFPLLLYIDEERSSVSLPRELFEDIAQKSDYIDIQFGLINGNPFWWHQDSLSFNTEILFFDLFVNCDRIKTFKTPVFVTLRSNSIPKRELAGTLTNTSIASYRVEIGSYSLLLAQFDYIEKSSRKREMIDESEDDDLGKPFLLASWSECSCEDDDFSNSKTKTMVKGMSPEERLLRIVSGENPLTLYICVKKLIPSLTFRITSSTFACLSWDIAIKDWNKYECKPHVPGLRYGTSLVCECTRVSLVVGQITASTGSYLHNMDIDVTIKKVKNYVMISVVGGLFFLWIFSLVLAHHVDKSKKKKNVIHKLDDNVPGDSHAYLVVVFTGCFYDAQTTADVAIQLMGNKSRSRVHLIRCHGATFFKRNSQDWFIIYSPLYLGRLRRIKIWHNSKGKHPHWYCDRIIVQDLKTAEQYCFTVKKWFSVIWGSGKYYRVIHLKKAAKKIPEFLFRTHLERDMTEKNGWISILTRDAQSNFSSKERVSVGFCILFLSMLANGLIYNLPSGTPSDSIDAQSTYDITLANVIIFIESWLLATPMGFLLVFLFKNSAPI